MTKNYVLFDMMFVMLGVGVAFSGGIVPIVVGSTVAIISAYLGGKDLLEKRKAIV